MNWCVMLGQTAFLSRLSHNGRYLLQKLMPCAGQSATGTCVQTILREKSQGEGSRGQGSRVVEARAVGDRTVGRGQKGPEQ